MKKVRKSVGERGRERETKGSRVENGIGRERERERESKTEKR